MPDPNYFGGDVRLLTSDGPGWTVLAPSAGYTDAGRGVGLLDLHDALAAGRPHRASGEVALHVLEIMESIQASAHSGTSVTLTTTCERPDRVGGLVDLP